MPKSFGGAHREDAGAAMHNQRECTSTAVPSQMQSKNVPVRSTWPDFRPGWPLPAEVAESRGRCTRHRSPPGPGWAAGGDHLPSNRGPGALPGTCCRSTSLCGPSPLRATRQANGRVNCAGPTREPSFSLHARLHFLPRAYQALRGSRPRGTSVPFFLPTSHSAFHSGPL